MNLDYVRALTFAPISQRYDARDSALYAPSLGMGSDPTNEDELPYVYEGRGPLAAPSQCVAPCWPPFWRREPAAGIGWRRILHGEQKFVLHRPVAVEGLVEAHHHVIALVDKGARGAVLYTGHDIRDQTTGAPLADIARQAGFERPISHGLNTFGLACRAALKHFAPRRPERLVSMSVRFAAPAYPGDTIRIERLDDGAVRFRARAVERDVVVLKRGEIGLA